MMKKRIILIVVGIVFFLTTISCGKNYITEVEEIGTTEQIEDTFFDVPSGFTKEYEKADFDKYNSYASENGLAGTQIWVEGEMDAITTTIISNDGEEKIISSVITLDDGNKWLIGLDVDSAEGTKKYSELKNHRVCICGKYQGYSDIYEMPTVFMSSLFDRTDGKLINTTIFYEEQTDQDEEVGESGKPLTNEFDSNTNQEQECFGVHFELPSTWIDRNDDGDFIYFYPPDGMCMIGHYSLSITENEFNEEFVNDFLSGFSDGKTDYKLLCLEKSKVKNDGRDAYNIKFSYTYDEQKLFTSVFMFTVSDGVWYILYTDYENSDVDRSQDFQKVIDSITFDEIINDINGVTPSFKATMDKYEKFFDEYVDFMKRYADSDYSPDMLTDYTKLMTTYSEYMEELEKIENDKSDMTNEDWAYYIDVNARIQKKLLELSQ